MSDLRIETPQPDVRILTLSRPARRNALSRRILAELARELSRAEAEGTRALVITGAGGAFSAGADFADLRGDAADLGFDEAMSDLTTALEASRIVSFAAIEGPCIGAGLDLALACDFRIAARDACFALPAVRMGILYNPARLARLLPRLDGGAAARLLLLAERLDCDEAAAAGIVTHRAGDGRASGEADALALATGLAARAAALPPLALAATRDLLAALRGPGIDADAWQDRRLALLTSDERREALRRARTPDR